MSGHKYRRYVGTRKAHFTLKSSSVTLAQGTDRGYTQGLSFKLLANVEDGKEQEQTTLVDYISQEECRAAIKAFVRQARFAHLSTMKNIRRKARGLLMNRTSNRIKFTRDDQRWVMAVLWPRLCKNALYNEARRPRI